jgi:DNA ligase (NAD+)
MVLSDQQAEAKVVAVLWSPSKYGLLKPRVQIEPVRIGGVTIEFANGFDGRFIVNNRIGVGAIISLIRSGDVIPHIESVQVPALSPQMPTEAYEWTASGVDLVLANTTADGKGPNETVVEKQLTSFMTELEVDGLSSGNVRRLMAQGHNTVAKILALTNADLTRVEGFQQKMADKIGNSIRQRVAEASLVQLMVASGRFGRGLGPVQLSAIMGQFPNALTTPTLTAEQVQTVPGIGPIRAASFVDHIGAFLQFLQECHLEHKLSPPPANNRGNTITKDTPPNPFLGKSVAMTKVRDKDIIAWLPKQGATLSDNVTTSTFILVVLDKAIKSGKTELAAKYGIPIMTPSEFKSAYMG